MNQILPPQWVKLELNLYNICSNGSLPLFPFCHIKWMLTTINHHYLLYKASIILSVIFNQRMINLPNRFHTYRHDRELVSTPFIHSNCNKRDIIRHYYHTAFFRWGSHTNTKIKQYHVGFATIFTPNNFRIRLVSEMVWYHKGRCPKITRVTIEFR